MARSPSSLTYTATQIRQNAPNTSVGSHNRRRKRTVMRPIELTLLPFLTVGRLANHSWRVLASHGNIAEAGSQREMITNRGSIRLFNSLRLRVSLGAVGS